MYPLLSVRETLQFSAELRIPNLSKVCAHEDCFACLIGIPSPLSIKSGDFFVGILSYMIQTVLDTILLWYRV